MYCGIAPECNIISLKVLDSKGQGGSGDVLAGMQWVMDNKEKYNIRIANLSIGTNDNCDSDPLIKAVEACWDSGIVVLAAAGNNGSKPGSVTSPGICKKIITVGSYDDSIEVKANGTVPTHYSGRGPTADCIVKPDIIAPGSNIISCLTQTRKSYQKQDYKKRVSPFYTRLSGTSMSTPIVAGAIALLLEKEPLLKPNDIKLRLKDCAVDVNQSKNQQGWGLIDIEKLLN